MSVNSDIKRVIRVAFGQGSISRDGVNYAVSCPACREESKSKRKLEIRLDDGRYHCWVCGIKGSDIRYLIRKHRPDLIESTANLKIQKRKKEEETKEEELFLPKGVKLLGCTIFRDPDMNATKRYLKMRGLSEIDMMRWRIMASPKGKFRRKAIIPSFDRDGKLNYYVARSIDDLGKFRYKNAKVSKENVIFNEIDIDWKKPIILVEGAFDAIKCPENTIPILGSSLSRKSSLFGKILENQTPCTVALDPDLKMKAYKLASLIRSAGCDVKITFAPPGKDMGDLSKEEALSVVFNAKPYTDMMRLTQKISEIQSGSSL